jgi:cytochrome bd-type quinol oxidase subunit 2
MIPWRHLTSTHFQAIIFFAALISVAFGFLGRRQPKDRIKYILWSFLLFMLIGIGIGWAMYPFSH